MTRILRGLSVALAAGLGLVGTPAHAYSNPSTTPAQVTAAAAALGVPSSARLHTIQIDGGDDGSAVRSAVNSASGATAADPQFVYFPASKTYDFGSSQVSVGANVYIVLAEGMTITKEGSSTATLSFSGSPSGAYGGTWKPASGTKDSRNLFAARVTGVKFANLTLSGANQYGVYAAPGSETTMKGVTVTGSKRHGIYADGATLNLNTSSVIDNNVNGLALNNSSVASISKSKITGNGRAPETSSSGDQVGDGISVNGRSSATLLDTAVDSNGVNGVSATGPSTVTVTDGEISGNKRHGIGTRASSGAPTIAFNNTSATPTYVNDNAYNGILVAGGTDAYLKYVQIKRSKAWGLSVDKSTVKLKGSLVDASGLNNASIRNGSSAKLYGGNKISNAKGGTYNVPGPEGDKTEKGHGIAVSGGSTLTIHDPGNSFEGNNYYGILVSEGGTTGLVYSKAGSVKFSSNGVGPGKVQNSATFKLEAGFSTSEFPTFRADSGGRFTRG